jgi:hypothetical protein
LEYPTDEVHPQVPVAAPMVAHPVPEHSTWIRNLDWLITSSPPKIILFWLVEAPLLAFRDLVHIPASPSPSPHPREATSSQLLIFPHDFGPCAVLPKLPSVTKIDDFA